MGESGLPMQLSIDPMDQASALFIAVKANVDHPGGSLSVTLANEMGKTIARKQVGWVTERDLSGLPEVLRLIGNSFLWAPKAEVPLLLPKWLNRHMRQVPALGGRPA